MTETKAVEMLHEGLRKIPAVATLPTDEFQSLAAAVYDELELRVGTALSEGLSEAQLSEFEALLDYQENHPEIEGVGPALAWLQDIRPNYQVIVTENTELLLAETAAHFTTPH